MDPEEWFKRMLLVYTPGVRPLESARILEPFPDWQTAKIDAAIDYWEMQLLGTRL